MIAEILFDLDIPQFYGVHHETVQFVDDSNTVIGTDTSDEMELYLKVFHRLLKKYYHANKLQLNASKMTFIVTRKPANTRRRLEIDIRTNETVKKASAMKIFGVWRNNRNSYDTHLSKVAAIIAKAIQV